MPASFPTGRVSSKSRLQLKWLLVVLITSNLLVGVFSVYALRRSDHRYSELLAHSVPVQNDLQSLTADAAQALVATNPARAAAAGIQAAHNALDAEVKLRQHILAEAWLVKDNADRLAVAAAGSAFTSSADAVLSLVESGRMADAAKERDERLLPAFSRYLDVITEAADTLQAETGRRNAAESGRTATVSTVVLGVASWPIVALVLLLAVTLLFVLAMMFIFRGAGTSDMP